MKILCTMPGRFGDIFWSLAAVRAVAEQYGEQVDFATSPKYAACLPIVEAQPYVRRAFQINGWEVLETAPMTPHHPPVEVLRNLGYDHILNLGYTRWPAQPLAFEIAAAHAIPLTVEDLGRPWIAAKEYRYPLSNYAVVTGFTDEWVELKAGLVYALASVVGTVVGIPGCMLVLAPRGGSRLTREWPAIGGDPYEHPAAEGVDLLGAAGHIQGCGVFLGCLSALAVLAAAMGKPRILVEPNPQRHHPIFQHWDTPLVAGNDGLPTFDARHVAEELRKKLGSGSGSGSNQP